MPAQEVYRFGYVAPGETTNIFIHNYSNKRAVAYSGVGEGLQQPAGSPYPPQVHFTVSQGETYRHVDGTVARKVYVTNQAPNSAIIHVNEIYIDF